MKKIIFLFSLFVFLSACKKQYNCFCNTAATYSSGSGQSNYTSANKPLTEKMTKKQAKAVCDNEAENIDATYSNFWAGSRNSIYPATFHTNCTLQ